MIDKFDKCMLITNINLIRVRFSVVLCATLLILLTPGHWLTDFNNWAASWIPFASQLDNMDASHYTDKVVHGSLFSSLGYLAVKGWVLRNQLIWVLAGLVWLAPQSEWAQTYIPGRGASLADVAADVAGLAVGVGWALWCQRRRTRRSALGGHNLSAVV